LSFIIFFVVPTLIFIFAALFATLIFAAECAAASPTDPADQVGPRAQWDPCSWYGWFLYVMGNLVALATPLTNLSTQSGHTFSELVDLLVAVWALALAASFIGIVSSLQMTQQVAVIFEEFTVATMMRLTGAHRISDLVAEADGMQFDEFYETLSMSGIPLSVAEARAMFNQYDKDGSGSIDKKEGKKLMEMLQSMKQTLMRGSSPAISPRPDEEGMQRIASALEALQAEVASMKADIAALASRQQA